MAGTVVQHKKGSGAANANTQAVTVTAFGAGRLIVVGITGSNSGRTVLSVTDNSGSPPTYLQATNARGIETASAWSDIWYALSSSSGATTVTVTFSATNTDEKNVEVWEVSGLTGVAFDLASHVDNQPNSSTPLGPSITTTGAVGFAVGVAATDSGVTANPHAGNAFTSGGDISTQSVHGFVSLLTSSAASIQPQWDTSGSLTYAASVAAWKQTSGAARRRIHIE